MMLLDRIRLRRRGFFVGGALLAAALILLGVASVAARLTGGTPSSRRTAAATTASGSPAPITPSSPAPTATDVAFWDAIAPVSPSTSEAYPPISAAATRDPYGFARAFATELFTRDYRASTRAELVAWAQYEDAPLRSPNYPRSDWTKVLVDSLTDLTWDGATDTPIPADGPWLALHAERATDSVSQLRVTPNSIWQQRIAAGYQPPDELSTVLDVSLTVTQRRVVAGHASASRYAIAITLQLGTSARGSGYGIAATNNYVIKEVS